MPKSLQRSTIKALCGLHLWIEIILVDLVSYTLLADEVTKSIWIIEKLKSHYEQEKEVSGCNVLETQCAKDAYLRYATS